VPVPLQALEYKRTSRSLTLAEEKKLIQEMNGLKALRQPLAEYAAYEAELAELRENRSIVGARLSVLATTIREMRDGIRKLEVVDRLQVRCWVVGCLGSGAWLDGNLRQPAAWEWKSLLCCREFLSHSSASASPSILAFPLFFPHGRLSTQRSSLSPHQTSVSLSS
jgi:hypothetical protein